MATINDLRQVIEHCPPPNDQHPYGLLGWTVEDGHVCAKCASRIIGRGCGTMLKGAEAIWEQSDKMCSLCFQIMKNYRGIKPLNWIDRFDQWDREKPEMTDVENTNWVYEVDVPIDIHKAWKEGHMVTLTRVQLRQVISVLKE